MVRNIGISLTLVAVQHLLADGFMQPWGKLEAWREESGGNLGCSFELLADQAVAFDGTLGRVECRNSIKCKRGGKFSLHTVVPSPSKAPACVQRYVCSEKRNTPSMQAMRNNSKRIERRLGSRLIGNSLHVSPEPGVDISGPEEISSGQCGKPFRMRGEGEGEWGAKDEGFVMEVELKRGSQVGGLAVQIGNCHLGKEGDAGVFLALAAAVELSAEACQATSKVLKQVLRRQTIS